MKFFNVFVNGIWSLDYVVEAKTKEEAIKKAMTDMEQEAGPIYLEHIDQYAEETDDSMCVIGPSLDDMKISSEFFPKIMDAKYKKEEKERRLKSVTIS